MTITRVACVAALAAVAAVAWPQACSAADASGAMPVSGHEAQAQAVADGQGNLHVPSDYRTTYEFLGTWAVAAKPGPGSKEIHDVYASPGTIAAFHKDGHFPDGTVLVKEVYATATASMTNCLTPFMPSPGLSILWLATLLLPPPLGIATISSSLPGASSQ